MATFALAIIPYLLLGNLWWRRIVLPKSGSVPAEWDEPTDDGVRHWRQEAKAAEARGDIALLIVKATFVLLWPLALAFGFVWARID